MKDISVTTPKKDEKGFGAGGAEYNPHGDATTNHWDNPITDTVPEEPSAPGLGKGRSKNNRIHIRKEGPAAAADP